MGKKFLNPLEDPPNASSSDEDEVETSSREDDEEQQISGSSSEPTDPTEIPRKSAVTTTAANPDSDSESGSETDSDSEYVPAEKKVKNSPAMKSKKKRASEGSSKDDMHVKRAKKDNKKKAFCGRLWSEEDEISLLQGITDFKAETGKSPFDDDIDEFYDIVKNYISFDVSKKQFGERIRGLKNKYFGKQQKRNLHDKKCLRLAMYIWGSKGMALECSIKWSNGKSNDVDVVDDTKVEDKEVLICGRDSEETSSDWFEESFLVRCIVSLGVDEYSVKRKWSKVPMETKKRFEEKWKLVEGKEVELLVEKIDILKEIASVFCEVT